MLSRKRLKWPVSRPRPRPRRAFRRLPWGAAVGSTISPSTACSSTVVTGPAICPTATSSYSAVSRMRFSALRSMICAANVSRRSSFSRRGADPPRRFVFLVGQALDLVVDVVLVHLDLFGLGDFLQDEMLLERHLGVVQDVLLEQPLATFDLVLAHAGFLHFHDLAGQVLAGHADQQVLGQLPGRGRRDLGQHLLAGRLTLFEFQPFFPVELGAARGTAVRSGRRSCAGTRGSARASAAS